MLQEAGGGGVGEYENMNFARLVWGMNPEVTC